MSGELINEYYNASLPRPLCQGPNRGMKKHQYNYCMFVGGFTPLNYVYSSSSISKVSASTHAGVGTQVGVGRESSSSSILAFARGFFAFGGLIRGMVFLSVFILGVR